MPVSYEEALAFLQKSGEQGTTVSVYESVVQAVSKLLEQKPSNGVDLLPQLLSGGAPIKASPHLVPISSGADAAKAVAASALFGNPDLPIDPETGEPIDAAAPNEYESEDVLNDGALFDALGVGLGRQEMYNVMLACKKLGEDPNRRVATVRFFGKILGLHADYYVFETTVQEPPEIPEGGRAEPFLPPNEVNMGANNYVYFVCNYLGGPFSQLPYVTPEQIKAARLIKKIMTGRLTSHVSTYPPFPGTEANYLRAQISRIACSTVSCPTGCFTNDDGTLQKAEDWEGITGKDAAQPANWCHRYSHLKKQGRCELAKQYGEDADPPEGWEPSEEEQEEGPEPLASLESDTKLVDGSTNPEDGAPSWSGLSSSSSEAVKFQVGGVRSNLWPGAVCAAKGQQFTNLYVGWAIKNALFVPLPPPPIAKEFDFAAVESQELPPKPAPPAPEGEGDE